MRLFVALALTDEARAAIAAEQQRLALELREATYQPRWVRSEQMHLTLAFIGHVERPGDAVRAIETLAVPQGPFEIGFGGCGLFPPRGAPRVFWLGIQHGLPELIAVRTAVVAGLSAAGIPFDAKPFHPHLTLARWRESRPSDGRAALTACGPSGPTPPVVGRMRVEAVSLYDSRTPQGAARGAGPAYTPLTRVLLAC